MLGEKIERMNNSAWIRPSSDMDFWKINSKEAFVKIKWSHNYFDDYKTLSYQCYECGYQTFQEVIKSGHNNIKSDMWFLPGVFLVRHSIELGLKALICRTLTCKKDIQDIFKTCCHDVSTLFHKYTEISSENYLSYEEKVWVIRYLDSLEKIDQKSDTFRFPFEDKFFYKYGNQFLDNVHVAKNMLQCCALIKKCLEKGIVIEEDKFDERIKPEFFVFTSHGMGNCYLRENSADEGCHLKFTGYSEVIDYIYQNQNITNENKLYPLIFMCRNTIELCLKSLINSGVDTGVLPKESKLKYKSHFIKKDLWKIVRPAIEEPINDSDGACATIDIVEGLLGEIDRLDKKGDNFRYPTSYSLEYRFDNKELDISNVYIFLKAIINFLDGYDSRLNAIADC